MKNTPLDAPTGFTPSDEERPAGQWMESYWAQTVPWARYFAFVVWAYVAWITFRHLQIFSEDIRLFRNTLFHLLVLVVYVPTAVMGYYSYRFAQDLEAALAAQDQLLLEKAFRHLHRFLLLGMVVGVFELWSSIGDWYSIINLLSEPDPGQFVPPLQSE